MALAQYRMEEYANKSRNEVEVFKEGDRVWLDLKNIQTPQLSKKLSWINAKYKVAKIIDSHCVELDTPSSILPRFHVDSLKRAAMDPLPSQTWIGFAEPTWEPRENLEETVALDVFEQIYGKKDNTSEEMGAIVGRRKTKCTLEPHVDTTTYVTILILINWSSYIEPFCRLRLVALDPELFCRLLSTTIRGLDPNQLIFSKKALENYATGLTDAERMVYMGAARRSLGQIEIPVQNKPIIEPVPPSKRAAQHTAESFQDSITDNHHPFLPQELVQIFKVRQKQEHLWHTRLMVCTSFYSFIECAATSFKDCEDKDLAIMLQENLKSTIAKFAASDADPKAYRPQLKSSNTKHIESVKPKKTSQSAPVAIPRIFSTTNSGCKVQNSVNPTLPPKPIVNMSSWSTAVQNGFKKTKAPQDDCYIPFGGEEVRSRAATYTRKDPNRIKATQKPTISLTEDYCWVVVNDIMFLNVYKAPQNPSAVQPLLNWVPPSKAIAFGDFNSVHWVWQPSVRYTYGQGEEIEKLAELDNMSFLIIGEPTHRAVEREECVTSDHLPIFGSLISNPKVSHTSEGPLRVTKDRLPQFAKVIARWMTPVFEPKSIVELDKYGESICIVLTDAIKAVGSQKRRAAIMDGECSTFAKEYKDIIALEKREYWKTQIEKANSAAEAFKLVRLSAQRHLNFPPPIFMKEN
ncbi:hypothetical protein EPUL_001555 [Erysiphe pulchra]|uniref:Endonuclease/exonuclease/phosphatase domain-containing protein n=1 Tax=Erysiphe pulchra TaxID=225359 RepID=A0A2S4PTN2_9PEZI|nr:hypothetical protein EPUL_001555 [Erysiphe pulchra]